MLHRVIYVSDAVGGTGATTLSIAEILGVSASNNQRDHLTGCILFHDGRILQAVEGERTDIDRLLRRLREDRRHANLRVVLDAPITERAFTAPLSLCADASSVLARLGGSLDRLAAADLEALMLNRAMAA